MLHEPVALPESQEVQIRELNRMLQQRRELSFVQIDESQKRQACQWSY